MADEITVENTTPGRRILDSTELNPGETKTLSDEADIEKAEHFIEKGDFKVIEGESDAEPDSQEDEDEGETENKEAKKGIDSESVVRDLPYLSDEQKEQLIEEYDNLAELQEGLSQEDLEELEDIGEAYAEDIFEAIQEQ